jgi:hypothetical protein
MYVEYIFSSFLFALTGYVLCCHIKVENKPENTITIDKDLYNEMTTKLLSQQQQPPPTYNETERAN